MTGMAKAWTALGALVAILILLALGTALFPDGSRWHTVALVLWGAFPAAVAIGQFLYERVERHRLWVDRLRFRLSNRESEWSLTASFDVDNLRPSFDVAEGLINELPGSTRLADAHGVAVWQVRGSTVRLAGDVSSAGTGVLRVEFPSAPRQFRAWPSVIDGTVDSVVSAVQDAIPTGARKFVANIGFPGSNPYFGFFVAQAPPSAVKRFDVEIVEPAIAGADRVLIRADRIEIVTSSLSAIRQLSRKYLSLEPMEAG